MAEVERLLAGGVTAESKPFESLGYRQALLVVRGEMSIAQAISDTALRTRQYAKRQMTWFRREPGIEVVNGFGDHPEVAGKVLERVRNFISIVTCASRYCMIFSTLSATVSRPVWHTTSGFERWFIGVVNAGEAPQFTAPGPPIEALYITLFTYFDGRIDVDLDETSDRMPHFIPHGAIGGDCRYQDDDAVPGQQSSDVADTTDVFVPIRFGEAQSAAQMPPEIIAVQRFDAESTLRQEFVNGVIQGGLPRPAQSGKPNCQTRLQLIPSRPDSGSYSTSTGAGLGSTVMPS